MEVAAEETTLVFLEEALWAGLDIDQGAWVVWGAWEFLAFLTFLELP